MPTRALVIFALLLTTALSYGEETAPTLKQLLDENSKVEQQLKESEQQAPADAPADDYLRGTPRSSFSGFVKAILNKDYSRASHYVDFRNLPKELAAQPRELLVKRLATVISRAGWIDLEELDNSPRGRADDGLPSYRDRLVRLETNQRHYEIYLQRIPRGDGAYIWKISNATMVQLPELYDQLGDGPLGEWLSERLPDSKILGVPLWQWVLHLGIMGGIYLALMLPTWLAGKVFETYFSKLGGELSSYITGPVRLLLVVIISRSLADEMQLSASARAIYEGGTLLVITWLWALMRGLDLYLARLRLRWEEDDNKSAANLLRPIGNSLKIVMFIIALLIWVENLGFKASTLLAGLGIGGLALAMAAKTSLENIIGAITLYTSRPIKIGNVCRFGNKVGTVEEIGLRATRIRTLNRSVHHVPNAKLADMELENISEREKIRYNPAIGLTLDTTPEQVEQICSEIRQLLENHDSVDESPLRVRFKKFGLYALELDIHCYVHTQSYPTYLEIAEQLNLDIMRIIQAAGSRLAVPPGLATSAR